MIFAILKAPVPVSCFLVEGKTVSPVALPGHITRLATTAAEIELEGKIVPHVNVKLILASPEAAAVPEIYGKVVEHTAASETLPRTTACVALTSVPSAARAFLEQLRATALHADRMRVG
jgi:hypothetical protein